MFSLRVRTAYLIALIVILLDQGTKYFVRDASFVVQNTGAAFGILQGRSLLLIVIAVIAIGIIISQMRHYPLALGLLLGGTIGNLIDRIALGYVIDFIHLPLIPTFNIADTANTIAACLLVLFLLFSKK